jgi:hypothetical protein
VIGRKLINQDLASSGQSLEQTDEFTDGYGKLLMAVCESSNKLQVGDYLSDCPIKMQPFSVREGLRV